MFRDHCLSCIHVDFGFCQVCPKWGLHSGSIWPAEMILQSKNFNFSKKGGAVLYVPTRCRNIGSALQTNLMQGVNKSAQVGYSHSEAVLCSKRAQIPQIQRCSDILCHIVNLSFCDCIFSINNVSWCSAGEIPICLWLPGRQCAGCSLLALGLLTLISELGVGL